ncbi:hypothetical protein AB0J66_31960, partial [Actinoplanes sp. NPDC049598]
GTPASGSPFGATPDQPASGSPYGTPASGSPFGTTPDQPASGSPYGTPASGSPAGDSPFGQPGDSPYGKQGDSPFGQPGDSPYGKQGDSPFGNRQGDAPFGQPGDSPYGQQGDSPFGAPSASPFGPRPGESPNGNPPFGARPDGNFGDRPGPRGDMFNEMTTDVAGRDQQPYVPAPALPPMPPGVGSNGNGFGQPNGGGFAPAGGGFVPGSGPDPSGGFGPETSGGFGSAASRATVTPPSPSDTTSWPGPESEQGKFDNFKPDAPAAKPETPHVRVFPILLAVVLGAIVLLGVVFGLVFLVAGGKDEAAMKTGDCVKQDGSAAVKTDCGGAGTFQVVSVVDDKGQCADPANPSVLTKIDGKSQVLCLKPNS